ncbi:hypothetical protein OI25_607 [Paraburkholderia fungorum]|uniref:Uncharacterized protein n=1 Tax=Paraburkholderia fungorum TaxID=134537 RepID=A0AAU8SY40_9BURK|nr:hypothetical protein [Paraburkholderia fungorum]AJZ58798.1 hypothetical protein OI25_607 [Paraburkholderia fungorum]
MTVKFQGFDLYDEDEFAALNQKSGKSVGLRFLPDPVGKGHIVVILDLAFGFKNQDSEGVIGFIRDFGGLAPRNLATIAAASQYAGYLTEQFPTVQVAL